MKPKATSTKPKRQIATTAAVIAAVLAPLLGAGGGSVVTRLASKSEVSEISALRDTLRDQVTSLNSDISALRAETADVERRLLDLRSRLEDAQKVALACCSPKQQGRKP